MSFRVALCFPVEDYYAYLRQHGFIVEKVDMHVNDEDETIRKMKGFDAIAATDEIYSARVLDALKDHLKILVRHGVGYDKVDIEHAAKLGICCCNTPGAMSSGVAETAILMMLECSRKFFKRDLEMKRGLWNRSVPTHELAGATVGLVGFGNIAQRIALYLRGFRCRILAYDIQYNENMLEQLGVEKANMERLAAESDYVSVHIPYTEATIKFINAEFLSKMKPSAYLINTARGKVVDQDALIQVLKDKRIAGAGLDVFWNEPLEADSELRQLDNVFMTPHIATNTFECIKAGFNGILLAFNEFIEGKIPQYCVNPSYVDNIKR